MQENEAKTQAIMSRLLQPSDESALKLLGPGTMADRNVLLLLPPARPQAASPSAANLPAQATEPPRAPFADNFRWHHGGINE